MTSDQDISLCMTLLDQFAMAALTGYCSHYHAEVLEVFDEAISRLTNQPNDQEKKEGVES